MYRGEVATAGLESWRGGWNEAERFDGFQVEDSCSDSAPKPHSCGRFSLVARPRSTADAAALNLGIFYVCSFQLLRSVEYEYLQWQDYK